MARPTLPPLRITNFRGINKAVSATEIADNESPDMLNMSCTNGTPDSRTGYERVFSASLGAGKINGLYPYRKSDGTTVKLIHWGTNLYTQTGNVQPVSIYAGMNNAQSRSFDFGGKKYILDGANYLVYDGSTVAAVAPHVPVLTTFTAPTGAGTDLEDFNLLGAGFTQKFSGNGTDKVYQLALTNLDATPIVVKVDGVTKTLTTDYTVDRATGKVTFITAPANLANNVEITAYKTQAGFADRIKKCRLATIYGGANDTRVFASLNPDMPTHEWYCGVGDPTYWPENGFYTQGNNAIKAFAKHYDTLVLLKEPAPGQTTIWSQSFVLNSGDVSFPPKPVNDQIGCIATDSVQTIENEPTFLDRGGVYKLVSSTVRDERNVVHISEKIDPDLLNESNLANAVSFDTDRKYWLCVNGKVYVLDYARKDSYDPHGIWYIYDYIHASCFMEVDGALYFGSDSQGLLYRFKKEDETFPYNDEGTAINAYWKSKQFAFGADERKKLVDRVFYTLKPASRTSVDLYYVTNKKQSDLVKTSRMDSFDFNSLDFNMFSFMNTTFPQEVMAKIKAKKITHFQLHLQNGKLDESMGIMSVGIKYRYQSEVK